MIFELLTNARVFAPQPLGLCHLLVVGERIAWLGPAGGPEPQFDPRLGLRRTECEGRTLVPGLVDGHAHLTGGGGEAGFRTRVPEPPLSAYTRAGVTSVVGVLGTDDLNRGPGELLARARALNEEGLSAWCHVGGYHVPPRTLTGSLRGDIVHIDLVLGVGELALSDHRSSQPSFEEFLRIASEAHVAGLMSGKAGIVHLHLGDGVRGLELVRRALDHSELPPRVFQPTHVNRRRALFEEALELGRRGVPMDLTAFPLEAGEDAWSAAEGLERWLESGVDPALVSVSSDAGGCLPHFDAQGRVTRMGVGDAGRLWDSVRELLARGHALERVLPAFCSNPARQLRLAHKGQIALGADADLLLLGEGNRILDTMVRGRWHLRAGELLLRGTFETPSPAFSSPPSSPRETPST